MSAFALADNVAYHTYSPTSAASIPSSASTLGSTGRHWGVTSRGDSPGASGTATVHGDPNARNIRMTSDRVAPIDWDEAHVDVPDLDLVMPHNAAGLEDEAHDIAAQASAVWEAASAGTNEHSIERLAEVRAV